MSLFKTKKLNSLGFAHTIALVLVVVGAGILGSLYLLTTHANSLPCGYVNQWYGGTHYTAQAYNKGHFCLTNGSSKFIFQGDGNLVLYSGSTARWSSGTTNRVSSTGTFELQKDGNMVIYDKSGSGRQALWASGTNKGAGYWSYMVQTYSGKVEVQASLSGSGSSVIWHKP